MNPFARGFADFIGEIHRPFGAMAMAISLFTLPLVWEPSTNLALVMGVNAGTLAYFVQARSSENKTKIKADAEVKKEESKATGRPSVGALSDAAVVAASPPIADDAK
jgi:hypothetical protein